MKAFVTGGTGFLGTHLIKALDEEGWHIVALHRPNSNLTELKKCKHVEFAPGDITDIESLRRGMPEQVDAVFHCAGSVGNLPHSQEKSRYLVNQQGTQNVVEVCKEKKMGRLIYTTTVLTYDFHAHQPLTEKSQRNLWCHDAYIQSKRLADEEIDRGLAAGLDAVYMHPSALFGSYDKDTWSKMFREINRGLPTPFAPPGGFSASHAKPVAKAHVAAFHKAAPGEHYLLGGPNVSILEVLQEVAKLLNKKGPSIQLPALLFKFYGWNEFLYSSLVQREPMLTPHTIDILCETILSDSSKAIRELGYQPSSLQEMLLDCHQWIVETNYLK